jgi:HEAT repeat protein
MSTWTLIKLKYHPVPRARQHAAIALAKSGDSRACKPLLAMLRDSHPIMRATAASAVVDLAPSLRPGPKESLITSLASAMKDEKDLYAWATMVGGLKRARWTPTGPEERALFSLLDGQWKEAVAEGKSCRRALKACLLPAFGVPPGELVKLFDRLTTLGRGDIVVETLLEALSDPREDIVIAAARNLADLQEGGAIDPILAALPRFTSIATQDKLENALASIPLQPSDVRLQMVHSKRWIDRRLAAKVLPLSGDERSLDALLHLVAEAGEPEHEYADVRSLAAGALGALADKRAVPSLLRALKDRQATVRGSAARALGRIGAEEAIPALKGALADLDTIVQKSAQQALERFGTKTSLPNPKWPEYEHSHYFVGSTNLKVINSGPVAIKIAVIRELSSYRLEGTDAIVRSMEEATIRVVSGKFQVYFRYENDPEGVYRGDDITFSDTQTSQITIGPTGGSNYSLSRL